VRHGQSRVEITVNLRATYKKSAVSPLVEIFIPVPVDAETPSARPSAGSVKYKPDCEALVWTLSELGGGREERCSAQYALPTVRASDPAALLKAPVRARFEVPFFTVSGFQVRFLKVTEPKLRYETLPWVRYSSKSGEYQVRTA
jgi:AP-1 complex subunit mu